MTTTTALFILGFAVLALGAGLLATLKRIADLEVDVFMLSENLKNQNKNSKNYTD